MIFRRHTSARVWASGSHNVPHPSVQYEIEEQRLHFVFCRLQSQYCTFSTRSGHFTSLTSVWVDNWMFYSLLKMTRGSPAELKLGTLWYEDTWGEAALTGRNHENYSDRLKGFSSSAELPVRIISLHSFKSPAMFLATKRIILLLYCYVAMFSEPWLSVFSALTCSGRTTSSPEKHWWNIQLHHKETRSFNNA